MTEQENIPAVANQGSNAAVGVAQTRAAQEVQAAMIVAQRFPRNSTQAFARIMESCQRRSLAERSIYSYPRGRETVRGPSIRLAEAIAQNWGNLDFGIVELEQRAGESTVMAYAWDLETNTRQTKVFQVPHERHTRQGVKPLTDPRDIYELVANQGARRLRACVLGVIPGDVVEAAVDQCGKTLASGHSEPIADRIRSMVSAFQSMNVTGEMISKRLGHPVERTTEQDLVTLRGIYESIRDNMATVEDHFREAAAEVKAKTTNEAIMAGARQVVDSAPERLEVTEPEAETVPAGEMFPDGGGDPEGAF